MSLPKRLLLILCALALVASACGGGDDESSDDGGGDGGDPGGGSTVTAIDFGFNPDSIEIDSGSDVELTLQNNGESTHSMTFDDADFDIEAAPGESATGTLTQQDPGTTLAFHCKFHPQMTGEVVVAGGDAGAGGGSDDTGEGAAENDDGVDY